jgi:U6 snRNA-associated Sm-like protein LSm8
MAQNQFLLEEYVDAKVLVVCNDGRVFTGLLTGLDQATNLILSNCQERVFQGAEGCYEISYGIYMLRGDNVATVGQINEEIDDTIDLENVNAEPLKAVVH